MRYLLASAAVWGIACGQPRLQPSDPTPGAPHFTVMTYNVEFHSAGEPTTLAAIGERAPDVVALQEMTPGMEAEIRVTYADLYPFQLFDSAGGTDGLAVLSRYELVDRGIHPGPGGWHPAWHVDVAIPGVSLQLLNVHLRSLFTGNSGKLESYLTTASDHLLEIEDFAPQCDGSQSNIVVGDFNEDGDGEAVEFLQREGFDDVLPQFHPGQPTWRYRSVAGQLEDTVDHILYDDSLRALDSWVEVKGRSDHLPVLAHFEPLVWVSPTAAE